MYSSPPAKSRKTGVPVWNIPLVSDGDAVYTFPDAYDYWLFASEVNFIAFRDVNGDGQKDVITSEQYITGAGEGGAVPFSMTRIYLNQGSEFLFAEGLSVSIGNSLDAPVPKNIPLKISSPPGRAGLL